MPEFVTCKFLKRLKTKEFEDKKNWKIRISELEKKTEMIVCETWKFIRNE